jgi:hypothetical protein
MTGAVRIIGEVREGWLGFSLAYGNVSHNILAGTGLLESKWKGDLELGKNNKET